MNTPPSNRSFVPLVLLCLAGPAGAQSPGDDSLDFTLDGTTTWNPALGAPGVVTRMVAGKFNGDGEIDAVVLAGSQPALLYSVTTHSTAIPLPAPATDLDVARGAAPGGWDAVAVVRDTGLVLVTCDAASAAYASANIATSEWLGALRVRCADLDASGAVDYVGLGANGSRILVHRSSGASPDASFDCPETVLEVEPLRWETNVWRIAVRTSAGVRIYDLAGTQVEPLYVYSDTTAMTVLDGTVRDRIGLLYDLSGTPTLTVLKRGAPSDDPQEVPGTGAFGLASADVDFDRADEVVLTHLDNHGALFVKNRFPGLPNLALDEYTVLNGAIHVPDFGPTTLREFVATAPTTAPLFADLDGDGRGDVLLSVRGALTPGPGDWQQFVALTNGQYPAPPTPPPLPPGQESYLYQLTGDLPESLLAAGETVAKVGAQVVNFTVEVEGEGESTFVDQSRVDLRFHLDFRSTAWPATANAVQIILWRQESLPSALDHHAVTNEVWPLGSIESGFAGLKVELPLAETIGEPGTAGCFNQIYWVEVRPVVWDDQAETVTETFNTRVCAIGRSSLTMGAVWGIVPWVHADHMPVPSGMDDGCGGWGGATVLTGIRRRRIPATIPPVPPVVPLPHPSEGSISAIPYF